MLDYLKHVRSELVHVAWPSTYTAVAHTLVVIGIALAIAALVGILDYGFGLVVSRVIGA
jgi:preprotein translocase SecE subunit